MGAGFAWVLIVLGGLREMLGRATLFSDWHVLAGGAPLTWQLPWFQADGSGLLAKLLQSVTKHKWAHPFKRPVTEKELTLTLTLALTLALTLTLTLTEPYS